MRLMIAADLICLKNAEYYVIIREYWQIESKEFEKTDIFLLATKSVIVQLFL